MSEFFQGWKRKAGCVTLLLACVLAASWIRSFKFADRIELDCVCFISENGKLYVGGLKPLKMEWDWPEWTVEMSADIEVDSESESMTWRFIGFEYHEGMVFGMNLQVILAHYWSIVIPLTLISAWLLLSKPPRQKSAMLEIPVS